MLRMTGYKLEPYAHEINGTRQPGVFLGTGNRTEGFHLSTEGWVCASGYDIAKAYNPRMQDITHCPVKIRAYRLKLRIALLHEVLTSGFLYDLSFLAPY